MRKILIVIGIAVAGLIIAQQAMAQKVDEEKMQRDLEVAETVLSSLMQRPSGNVFGFGRKGSAQYVDGYGVILNVPHTGFSYVATTAMPAIEVRGAEEMQRAEIEVMRAQEQVRTARAVGGTVRSDRSQRVDSLRAESDEKFVETMKTFLVDYADLIGQLKETDKIKITDKSDRGETMIWFSGDFQSSVKRSSLSAEIKKSDLNAFKAGKISRDEALKRIIVTTRDTEMPVEQDLELLASIFNRLYRSDLSKTYYMDGRTYYERMPDYGAIFSMNVFSSQEMGKEMFYMPTIAERDLSQADRDKKVKDLYPQFEKELKENILEYGRTVKSLKDDEQLVFKVKLTKCTGCGIPSTLDASVKASVLKDYSAGKTDKNTALSKISLKKGPNQ